MRLDTFNKFKKMMSQTFTESDGEALNALRAANRILAAEGITWVHVLDRSMRVDYDIEPAPEPRVHDEAKEINDAFAVLAGADLAVSFEEFIESLAQQWSNKKRLSPNQKAALFKAADRERNKDTR